MCFSAAPQGGNLGLSLGRGEESASLVPCTRFPFVPGSSQCCLASPCSTLTCDFKTQGLAELLHQELSDTDAEERHSAYLRPFRILVSLLDKPDIGTVHGPGPATAGAASSGS